MSVEENKAIVRKWYDGMSKGNIHVMDELFSPKAVWH